MEDVNDNNRSRRRAGGPAPFVVKTYRMVDDPMTDSVIAWGKENSSFVVVDLFAFSSYLPPFHFKHRNFSSFVRQLDTCGFRKVDPGQWEFAHALFRRGHTHLLHHIVRRNGSIIKRKKEEVVDLLKQKEEGQRVALMVAKLQKKQRATEEEAQQMWRRMKEIEMRSKQLIAFLLKVIKDAHLLQRLPVLVPKDRDEGTECRLGSSMVVRLNWPPTLLVGRCTAQLELITRSPLGQLPNKTQVKLVRKHGWLLRYVYPMIDSSTVSLTEKNISSLLECITD